MTNHEKAWGPLKKSACGLAGLTFLNSFLLKMVLPDFVWVIIVFDCPEVPLLCKVGLGEVETWSRIMWVPPCNLSPIA